MKEPKRKHADSESCCYFKLPVATGQVTHVSVRSLPASLSGWSLRLSGVGPLGGGLVTRYYTADAPGTSVRAIGNVACTSLRPGAGGSTPSH